MDKVKKYSKIIEEELNSWVEGATLEVPGIEFQLIVDKEKYQFILLALGWKEDEYVHDWLFHIQIKDEQVWIHEDQTGAGIAKVLKESGIPASDLILGFVEPYLREDDKLQEAG